MKTVAFILLFTFAAVFAGADDWETYELIDRLLALPGPGAPVIFEDFVIFTAPSNLRTVGVAFAHENFASTYWFRQLLITQDRLNAPIPVGRKEPDPYKDSGILFYVHKIPENARELEYRLIVNGLWTVDPANSFTRRSAASGLNLSVITLPERSRYPDLLAAAGGLSFSFRGPPGEVVTVAGNFNNWDPFMYQLKEGPAGVYTMNLPLPPGRYEYVFFHRGERFVDPYNPRRVYSRDGGAASEVIIQ
jgi:hypothetical protein